MDYAIEYALMSDIYDSYGGRGAHLAPANEGFFDKIKKFLSGLWDAFIRKLQNLGNLFKKKPNEKTPPSSTITKGTSQSSKALVSPTKTPAHQSTELPKEVMSKNQSTTDNGNKTAPRFIQPNRVGGITTIDGKTYDTKLDSNGRLYPERVDTKEDEQKKRESWSNMLNLMQRSHDDRKRIINNEFDQLKQKYGDSGKKLEDLMISYNKKFLALSPRAKDIIDSLGKLIKSIDIICMNIIHTNRVYERTNNFVGKTSKFINELHDQFNTFCQDCESVTDKMSNFKSELDNLNGWFRPICDKLIKASQMDFTHMVLIPKVTKGTQFNIRYLVPGQLCSTFVDKVQNTLTKIKNIKKEFENGNEFWVGSADADVDENARMQENDVIIKGLSKSNTALGKVESTLVNLDQSTSFYTLELSPFVF